MSKPAGSDDGSLLTCWITALSMRDLGDPTLVSQFESSCIAPAGPKASPTTVPLVVFMTQPRSPSFSPFACVCLRKKTPCQRRSA
eukprot:4756838-Prymnesium_polylepis.1